MQQHNFETTYRTLDGRVVRGGLAFDSPSHSRAGVLVTRGGSVLTKADYSRLAKAKALDAILAP
jgi:hypothetical protein